ncbi:Ig-like domain-containing protein [Rhodococcus sp. NPDC127528]|uniref:Ig-like domain-containing protein n=1 Tax=unclassified Rhodococcus (in: high G+C Gram-positive bacteria) TaxID=192944 RepID=UPI003640264F
MAVVAPAASAAPVTSTVAFQHQCRVDGATDWDYTVSDNLEVTAPAAVRPGEQFTVKLYPGQMRTSDSDTGRLKYDIAVPQGAELVSYALVGGTSLNLIGEAPVVLRVGADGNQNATGGFLRITGTSNKTINDGPSASDNKPKEGLQVKANTDFRLPAVELTLKAGTVENSKVTTSLRAGAASPVIKIKDTSLSFGESRWVNAAAYCVATGDGRGTLSSTDVFTPAVVTTTDLQVPATAQPGVPVDLKATVGPANSVGTVQFKDGDANIGGPVTVAGGDATLSHTFDSVGAHKISAVFTAGAGFAGSVSGVKTVDVSAVTTTALQVQSTAVVGDNVDLVATVTPSNAAGRIQFKDGATNIGAPVDVVNGTATLTRKFDEAGSHTFTADFVGAPGYNASASAPAQLTVKDADWGTTTTVLEPVTATVGTPVNLSATVGPIPTGGDVKFRVDGVEVGTAPVGTGDGVAILPHTFTTPGTAKVVAEFVGTTGFTGSTSAGFDVTVKAPDTREATTTALSVTGNATVGQAMTFKATVAPAGASGTVQFKSGTTALGAPVPVVDGVATLTHTFDEAGTHGVTASFVGGNGFKDSVSGPTVVNVAKAGTPGGGTGSLSGMFGS